MKLQELTAIIANINAIAATLGQVATSAQVISGEKTVMAAPDGIMNMSKKLLECCNQLVQLVPDIDIEIEGGSDANHCNDE